MNLIKGMKDAINLDEEPAICTRPKHRSTVPQQMLPQFNTMLYGEDSDTKANTDQL